MTHLALLSSLSVTNYRASRPQAADFDSRPDSGFIRARDLVRDPKNPNRVVPLDISLSTLNRYVKAGLFPKPIRLTKGVTVYKVGEVKEWIANLTAAALGLSQELAA
jgi:predicted DNA-binding transcriptional regulator AlpA